MIYMVVKAIIHKSGRSLGGLIIIKYFPMAAFLGTDKADYIGERGEFTLDCFRGNTYYNGHLSSCGLWIFADKGYDLLLSLG